MATNQPSLSTHLVLTLLVSTIIISLSYQQRLNFLVSPISQLTTPIRQPFFSLRRNLDNQLQFISNLPHQQRIIDDLKRQNAQLSLLAQKTKQLEAENQALKDVLSANITPNHQVLPVQIISLSRYAIINQGASSGLAQGMPIVTDDTLLGIITRTSANTSQVRLLTDPDTNIPATTLNQASGNLIFTHNTLQLTQVTQKQLLNPEEPVFTTGSEIIPAGLLIGTIKQITSNDSDVYQTATITPAATITQHQHLFVIIN